MLGDNGAVAGTNMKLTAAVEAYFAELGRIRASGGATGERSSYAPLAKLLDAVGATLKPKVFCVGGLAHRERYVPRERRVPGGHGPARRSSACAGELRTRRECKRIGDPVLRVRGGASG